MTLWCPGCYIGPTDLTDGQVFYLSVLEYAHLYPFVNA